MPQPEQLPGPNADIWNWQLQGLCRGIDSSVRAKDIFIGRRSNQRQNACRADPTEP